MTRSQSDLAKEESAHTLRQGSNTADRLISFCFKHLTAAIPQISVDVDLSDQTTPITGVNSGVSFRSARSTQSQAEGGL